MGEVCLLGEEGGSEEEGILLVALLLHQIQVLQTEPTLTVVLRKVLILQIILWFQVAHSRV